MQNVSYRSNRINYGGQKIVQELLQPPLTLSVWWSNIFSNYVINNRETKIYCLYYLQTEKDKI